MGEKANAMKAVAKYDEFLKPLECAHVVLTNVMIGQK